MAVNIAFAGGNACGHTHQRVYLERHNVAIYHTNTVAESRRECEQDIHSRIQPLCPLFVDTLRLIKGLYLGAKNGENGSGRVARLQLGG